VLDHYWSLHFLPQPHRYVIEMELALALAAAWLIVVGWRRSIKPAGSRIP
jgi:hypothetical protein